MSAVLKSFVKSNPFLFWAGVFHGALALAVIPGIFYDTRIVSGINPWVKPLKFDVSIMIFCLTMVIILKDFEKSFRLRMGRHMAICMLIETFCIGLQAFRGVKSHYNWNTWFDTSVYVVMGISITYNTLLLCYVAYLWLKHPPRHELPLVLGNGLGTASLVLGSLAGGYAAAQPGHTVGAPDGGPGIAFLNWSTTGGDLRIAHFVGLHGVQLLMLLGYLLLVFAPHNKQLTKGLLYGTFWIFCAFLLAVFLASVLGYSLV